MQQRKAGSVGYRVALLALAALSASAAEFQNGQAARAVLGQSSFSSRDGSLAPTSLALEKNRLFVADGSHLVWTFDLTKLPDVKEDRAERQASGCSVCVAGPVSITNQSVIQGAATVSVWGKTVAVVDTAKRRVLVWRDTSSARDSRGPDVILTRAPEGSNGSSASLVNPVSVAVDGKRLYVGDATLHRVLIWNTLPDSGDQPADVVLGEADFAAAAAGDDAPRADVISMPAALASDGTNLFVADSADHRVLVFSPVEEALDPNAAINAASLVSGSFAPGTLVTIHGTHVSDSAATAESTSGEAIPRSLSGTEVILDGEALPVLSVSADEAQVQIPYALGERSSGSLYVRTKHGNSGVSVSAPISVLFTAASPGIFAFPGAEPRQGMLLHGEAAAEAGTASPVTAESSAKAGEVLTIWASGLGRISSDAADINAVEGLPFAGPPSEVAVPVIAQINGQPAQVISAKLPKSAVGIYEVQIALPYDLMPGSPAQLSISQNGFASNAVTFPVQP